MIMFALHGLLDQRLKKLVLLCLVFSCLSSFNPQWAFAQDQSQKGGGWKGFKEKLLKLITPKSSAPTSSTSTTTTPTTTTTGTTTTTTTMSTTTTSMGVSPTSLLFTMTQGSTNSASQTLTITDTGQGTLSWSAWRKLVDEPEPDLRCNYGRSEQCDHSERGPHRAPNEI